MFLPILLALTIFLIFPSLWFSSAIGVIAWLYLRYAGDTVGNSTRQAMAGQVAFRILSVKMLRMNGSADDRTYKVHALATPDEAHNSELRSELRDAAALTDEDWKPWARTVKNVYSYDPSNLVTRFDMLVVQVSAQPGGIADATQDRLIEIAKLWKLGPTQTRSIFTEYGVTPNRTMLAWR